MSTIAIDPGPTESAMVHWRDGQVIAHVILENEVALERLDFFSNGAPTLAIEMIASYGMSVGADVFQTCVAVGRFIQAWHPRPHVLVYRREVKLYLCGSMKAKDGNIRQAIIDRFGGKAAAIGKKASKGPLWGIRADEWSALAVALTVEGRTDGKD